MPLFYGKKWRKNRQNYEWDTALIGIRELFVSKSNTLPGPEHRILMASAPLFYASNRKLVVLLPKISLCPSFLEFEVFLFGLTAPPIDVVLSADFGMEIEADEWMKDDKNEGIVLKEIGQQSRDTYIEEKFARYFPFRTDQSTIVEIAEDPEEAAK